jgi:protein-disulfide isomerase
VELRNLSYFAAVDLDQHDLAAPVDIARDHIRGPKDARVTLVEYGDFECPFCGGAEDDVRALLALFGNGVRLVWRHLPLSDRHPHAQLAAEVAEAAGAQGAFWAMHDLLITHQQALKDADMPRYAEELGLDVARFREDLRRHVHAPRVAQDVQGAYASGVPGTPTFFVNGRRHDSVRHLESPVVAVRDARQRWAG